MKRQDITKLHQLSVEELNTKLSQFRQELVRVQLQKRVGKASNPRMVSSLRDDIARVLTIMKKANV